MNSVVSKDGTAIAYDRSGEGPPLVVVVGAFSDRTSKKSLTGGLSGRFTVYEYDRRGRGDSDTSDDTTIEREVEDLAAVIGEAGGEPFVFGDSSGGALAIEAAVAGVAARKIAVYEVPYTPGPTLAVADSLERLVEEGQHGEAAAQFLSLMGVPPDGLVQMRSAPHWSHVEAFAGTLPTEVRLCNDGAVPADRLARLTAPLLALAGDQGPWAAGVAEAIAAAAPNGRARVLAGQGHAVADDALIPVLEEFFD